MQVSGVRDNAITRFTTRLPAAWPRSIPGAAEINRPRRRKNAAADLAARSIFVSKTLRIRLEGRTRFQIGRESFVPLNKSSKVVDALKEKLLLNQ